MSTRGYLNYIHDYYKKLQKKEVLLVFEGQVTHQVMKALATLIEEQLEEADEDEIVQRRVYHVLVESLQNINRHAETMEESGQPYPGRGLLLVNSQKDSYNVTSGNLIDNQHIEELSEFLAKINNLDQEALDDMYKHQLREGQLSPKGGAGLGFIDIKRKTGNPLDYNFTPVDERVSFFIFISKISR